MKKKTKRLLDQLGHKKMNNAPRRAVMTTWITKKRTEIEYMERKMKDQIEGSISTIEELCNENQYLEEMLSWAYGKLHGRNFINMEDALMADRINLWLEHRIAG